MISIVIPTYNHCEDLLKPCLESIRKYTDMGQVEVLVVANGCHDNTREYVESLGDPFKLLWYDVSLGFTKATNEGLRKSQGDYVVILNNDTILLEQKHNAWLDMLRKPFLDSSDVGLTGILELPCKYVGEKFFVFFCAMLSKNVFSVVGYLDEVFSPGSGEDIDLCLRIRNAGFKTVFADTTVLYPGSEGQPVFPIYHVAEGTFKHYSGWQSIFDWNMSILATRKQSGYYNKVK
jgi:GT2 family glycosyltransferase